MPNLQSELARQRLPLKQRLISDPDLAPFITAANDAAGKYELALLTHDEHLNQRMHVANVKARLSAAESAEEIAQLRAKLVELNTEPQQAELAARRLVLPLFDAFKTALIAVHDKAAEIAEGYAVEIQTAEELLFSQFGQARQATALSARLENFRAELALNRDVLLALNPQSLPGATHPALLFFTGN